MIAGHSALATISPWCSRWPLIRAEMSMRLSVCGVQAAPVTVGTPRWLRSRQRARRGSPARRACCKLTDDRGFVGADRAAVGLEPEGSSATAGEPARLGELLVLAADAAALVVALLAGHCTLDSGDQLAVPGREVDLPGHGGELDPLALAEVDEVLQFARVSVQAVGVVDEHGLDHPGFDLLQHARVLGPRLTAVGADVRVDVALDHLPAVALGQLLAVGQLSADREVVALTVGGDARIDACSSQPRVTFNHTGMRERVGMTPDPLPLRGRRLPEPCVWRRHLHLRPTNGTRTNEASFRPSA